MIGIAALWIALLLGVGGLALDRVLVSAITENFDSQLDYVLTAMVGSAEIDEEGRVFFNRLPADQRFLEPYSGLYFQISGAGFEPFSSRSLWDRRLRVGAAHADDSAHYYDSEEFPMERLRVIERDVRLPSSPVRWRFQVAQNRDLLDDQIGVLRRTLVRSFGLLGLGLIAIAAIQAVYGLWPLRRMRRAIAAIRTGERSRIDEKLPREIEPLTAELNQLLAHNERQAEEARRHAGNLAHALKTPLSVLAAESRRLRARGDGAIADGLDRAIAAAAAAIEAELARAKAAAARQSITPQLVPARV
ncbi:MAG: sensor histidine kinase N-terminal domain-containing protein, partial [Alphaproteobacteria bacterium]